MSESLLPPKPGVRPAQRFSPKRPCPICQGHALMEPGAGRRCYGYLSSDGLYAHCTREEHATNLKVEVGANTYAHRLRGECACGEQHGDPEPEREVTAHRVVRQRHLIVAEYPYFDLEGRLRYQVLRTAPKGFRQRRPTAKGGWIWSVAGVEPILYRWPAIAAAAMSETVYIVEGEKCVHAVEALGLVATTNPGGALKWRDRYNDPLVGRHVAVLADNDKIGLQHAKDVARRLKSIAASIAVVELPELPPKGDVVEWIAAGGTRDQLEALVASAREAQQPRGPAVLVRLSDVQSERLSWVWPGYLPVGKLVMIDGDPGLGKSTVTLDWIARITRGLPFPGAAGLAAPAGAVLLTLEDGLGDTIRPRLEAAGADLTRVVALRGVMKKGVEQIPALPDDLGSIEAAIASVGARMVVIDPIIAYLGGGVDSHRDQDVRRALGPLAQLAERLGVTIVLVRHLNKTQGGSAIYRGGGSIGMIGAARLGLMVARDPDDAKARVLSVVKSNLAAEAPSLRYRLESMPSGVARVAWLGESPYSADDLLRGETKDEHQAPTLHAAVRFLREVLARGPVKFTEIDRMAKADLHAYTTLQRAATELGVEKKRIGFGASGYYEWSLPGEEPPPPNAGPGA